MSELLNVVDDHGEITGTETREKIHTDGLLHREVNIWFYMPDGKLIFQHRAPDKDTNPNLLDATCGGHVDLGMKWLDTAVKEIKEESGMDVKLEDLVLLQQYRVDQHDAATGKRNNALQNIYAYCYKGKVEDLRVEQGKAVGFEGWPIQDLFSLSANQQKRFIFPFYGKEYLETFRKIQQLVKGAIS